MVTTRRQQAQSGGSTSSPLGSTPDAFAPAVAHMNADHRAHLSCIVSHHLSLPRPPSYVRMARMDAGGFEVEYEEMESFWRKPTRRGVRIPWGGEDEAAKEIEGGKEARPILVKMTREAQDALRARKQRPTVRYSLIPEVPGALILFTVLHYLSTTHPLTHLPEPLLSSLYIPLRKSLRLETSIPFLLRWIAYAHVFEACLMFAFVLVKKGGSISAAAKWAVTTLPVGFPTFMQFRKINPSWKLDEGGKKEH